MSVRFGLAETGILLCVWLGERQDGAVPALWAQSQPEMWQGNPSVSSLLSLFHSYPQASPITVNSLTEKPAEFEEDFCSWVCRQSGIVVWCRRVLKLLLVPKMSVAFHFLPESGFVVRMSHYSNCLHSRYLTPQQKKPTLSMALWTCHGGL